MKTSPSQLEGVRTSFIYALLDPETLQPRYVGKTTAGVEHRLKQHIMCARKTLRPSKRDVWIQSLLARGTAPVVEILEEGVWSDKDTFIREKHWIAGMRALTGDLLNMTNGGQGVSGRKRTPEQCARIQAAIRAYWQKPGAGEWLRADWANPNSQRRKTYGSAEYRARRGQITREVSARPDVKLKQSEGGKKGCASFRGCLDCDYAARPMPMGRHLKSSGHSGYVSLTPPDGGE